jgi:hypothetical protein
MLLIHLLAIAHLAGADPTTSPLKGAAKVAPEMCAELGRNGPRPPDVDDPGSGRPMSEDSASVMASINAMKPVGGVADDTALALLGVIADLSAGEGEADSIAAADMIHKLAPGSADRSKRARARAALGCGGAQGH